jgi:membrane protease YdiL (CAAX protease family)
MLEAAIYLVAIAGAEAVSAFSVPPWGMLCHIAILTAIMVRSALVNLYSHQRLMLPLALVPLMRIISLALGTVDIPEVWIYLVTYASLFAAAVVVVRILKYSKVEIGFSSQRLGMQLLVGVTGIALAFAAYVVLRPESISIIGGLTWQQAWLPALILLLYAGFVEEFVFRGLIQYGAVHTFGGWGIVYVSLLFAVLYIGFIPLTWVAFAFIISLYFGYIVKKTNSILGVGVAHSLLNVALYLVIPLLLG